VAAKGSPKTPRYVALAQVPVTGASVAVDAKHQPTDLAVGVHHAVPIGTRTLLSPRVAICRTTATTPPYPRPEIVRGSSAGMRSRTAVGRGLTERPPSKETADERFGRSIPV
jgi:hypothetical protein